MKFINYLIIKGNNIPSTAYAIFFVNEDQLLATPIFEQKDLFGRYDVFFYRSLDSNFYSLSLSDDQVIITIHSKLTRKINSYYHIWASTNSPAQYSSFSF